MPRNNYSQVDDLASVPNISPMQITSILYDRYRASTLYTRIGAKVLVALASKESTETQNSDGIIQKYLDDYKSTEGGHRLLPPHIFQTVTNAYLSMRRTGIDQAIILSGETGSGKSYTKIQAFYMLQALRESSKKEARLMNQIICATEILEAFGNAQTEHNVNASRFGNYTEIQFNGRGRVIGAKILDYILEKSRLTPDTRGQKNFHIFYYVCGGATPEERDHLKLHENQGFDYLNGENLCTNRDFHYNSENLEHLRNAFKSLGLNKKYQGQIFRLLSAILYLGNITFIDHPTKASEPASVKNLETLVVAANLLGLDAASLEAVLTYKTQLLGGEICTIFLNSTQAHTQRDDLARSLYSLLFSWLTEFLNTKLCSDSQSNFIGFVDLLGHQDFANNGFQEFCVNFANERLFHYCTHYLLEAEIEEYAEQGIGIIPEVDFVDNTPCLYMFMKPEIGLFATLEKQTIQHRMNSTDEELLQAFKSNQLEHTDFSIPEMSAGNSFIIKHYAGPVIYQVTGFLEKNTDIIGPDFIGLFKGSAEFQPTTNSFISTLFTQKSVAWESHPRNEKTIIAGQQPATPRRKPSMRKPRKTESEKDSNKISCVASQFQSALSELIESLKETEPWFVFCINPRGLHSEEYNTGSVKIHNQVTYLGLASISERKQIEYTSTMAHEEFDKRYGDIMSGAEIDIDLDSRQKCLSAQQNFKWSDKEMMVGKSKVYLCHKVWRELEDYLRAKETENKKFRKTHESLALSQMNDETDSQYDQRNIKFTSGYSYAPSYALATPFSSPSLYSAQDDKGSCCSNYSPVDRY
ncbi:hypothetical protein K7432_008882 [Basidiobolus ranarum]|uniref:Myosin motor domain-containing protein n=1 Tax=Basidiobolus ranarum TaxID=34480 RepID=A0ABR2VYC6_9FUNG